MNCEICNGKIGRVFLGKIAGTYVRDGKGKKRAVCFECQKKFKDKSLLLENLSK
ncbi:hypothetical protein HYU12_02580 [Candidatus Woesearchaeota archaeon]|nr:hypothetical protein [Candidatus Woesearchaeota archaeon]